MTVIVKMDKELTVTRFEIRELTMPALTCPFQLSVSPQTTLTSRTRGYSGHQHALKTPMESIAIYQIFCAASLYFVLTDIRGPSSRYRAHFGVSPDYEAEIAKKPALTSSVINPDN